MNTKFTHPLIRIEAGIIDLFLSLILTLLVFLGLSASGSIFDLLNNVLGGLIALTVFVPMAWAMIVSLFIAEFGGSPGQLLCGIRVFDEKGKKLSFNMAFFRTYVGAIVSGTIFWLGYFWMFVDKNHQGWHDIISGSFVTTRVKLGWLIGLVALLVILILNSSLFGLVARNFKTNSDVYQSIRDQATSALKNYQRTN